MHQICSAAHLSLTTSFPDILILFGTGVSLQYFLSLDENIAPNPRGTYLSVSFGWGCAFMLSVRYKPRGLTASMFAVSVSPWESGWPVVSQVDTSTRL